MNAEFFRWNKELMMELSRAPRGYGSGGPMADAYVPFSAGWTPRRTANAMLCRSKAEARALLELVKQADRNYQERLARDATGDRGRDD